MRKKRFKTKTISFTLILFIFHKKEVRDLLKITLSKINLLKLLLTNEQAACIYVCFDI